MGSLCRSGLKEAEFGVVIEAANRCETSMSGPQAAGGAR